MLNKTIFKAYDVRGLYPQEINDESVKIIAKALVETWNEGKIVVAHDGRHGSEEMAKLIAEEIVSDSEKSEKKLEIISVGLSTTPMYYFLVNDLNASGGAMITASHNPKEYNGIKAVREKAIMVSGTEILSIIEKNGYGL